MVNVWKDYANMDNKNTDKQITIGHQEAGTVESFLNFWQNAILLMKLRFHIRQ